jgi:trehalose 6-phosphate phosphatase
MAGPSRFPIALVESREDPSSPLICRQNVPLGRNSAKREKATALLPDIEISDFAVFLDLDGTLVEIAERPDRVRMTRSTVDMLAVLRDRTDNALAVISGREIQCIDRILRPLKLPAAGVHGLQRRDAAGVLHARQTPDLAQIASTLEATIGEENGIVVERKPGAAAVHFRQRPELERDCYRAVRDVIGERMDLHVMRGKMVFEILLKGGSKGKAIEAFLSERPFRGRRPLFAGDDTTDEAGFRVINARGGVSIKIGGGETLAHYRAANVSHFRNWLSVQVRHVNGMSADERS